MRVGLARGTANQVDLVENSRSPARLTNPSPATRFPIVEWRPVAFVFPDSRRFDSFIRHATGADMILDSFKLAAAVVQISYAESFELWDRSGAIARRLSSIWPGLKTAEGLPHQQTLKGQGMTVQTGFTQSTVTVSGAKALDQHAIQNVKETFETWRDELNLSEITQVSTRATYFKDFPSMKEANAAITSFGLVKQPSGKVFDQPMDGYLNGVELTYRFQDENSFSVLRLRAEEVKYEVQLDPAYVENSEIKTVRRRAIIDFDRGLLGSVDAKKLRMDDWLKGYVHILRRDIGKIIGEAS
jgi:hypothetical protein